MGYRCHSLGGRDIQVKYITLITYMRINVICSPLTANIYFPAIPELSRVFGKSVELINLTVTMYMVLQGVCE